MCRVPTYLYDDRTVQLLKHLLPKKAPHLTTPKFLNDLQDCALIPWFVRGYIMEHFRQIQLPPSDCPKVVLLSLPTDMNSMPPRCTTMKHSFSQLRGHQVGFCCWEFHHDHPSTLVPQVLDGARLLHSAG